MALLFVGVAATPASAQSCLGRHCWTLHKTEDQAGARNEYDTLYLAVTQIDQSVFSLQGVLGSSPDAVAGSAVLLGDNIVMTLNWSRSDSQFSSPTAPQPPINNFAESIAVQMKLKAAGLSETFTFLSSSFYKPNGNSGFGRGFFAGTAAYVSCQ
jgi:hypothetical protein